MVEPLVINAFRTGESAFMAESEPLWNRPASQIAGCATDIDLLQRIIPSTNLDQITNNSGHDPLAGEILAEPVANVSDPVDPIQ